MSSPAVGRMVGRAAEAERLRAAFDQACSQGPRMAMIAGEAGIGKSRLIEDFVDGLESPAVALVGRCADFGGVGPPFAPIVAVLRPLVAELGIDQVLEVSGAGAPSLLALVGAGGAGEPSPFGADRLNEAIVDVLEEVAVRHPLVIVVEDLHWADPATLGLLRFAVRQVDEGALFIVGSYRDDELPRGHPLRALVAEWERDRRIARIEPRRLNREEVREQLHALIGSDPDAAQVDTLFRRSEGVPFFVEELADLGPASADDLPSTIAEVLLSRYDALELDAQAVVRTIAAGGDSVDHALLEAVVHRSDSQLDNSLRSAVDSGVLRIAGNGYAFHHALVQEAVLGELLPGERTRIHRAYAEALEHDGDRPDLSSSVLIANHWMQAQAPAHAFDAAITAKELSTTRFAHATAAQMGERALDLWDLVDRPELRARHTHAELLREVAQAWLSYGEPRRAIAVVERALAEIDSDDQLGRARLLVDKSDVLLASSSPERREVLEEALRLLPRGTDDALRAYVIADLAGEAMKSNRFDDAIRLASEVVETAPESAGASASRAANYRGTCRFVLRQFDEAFADLELSRRLAGDDVRALNIYFGNASDAYLTLGRYEEGLSIATQGLQYARMVGVERSFGGTLTINSVDPLFALGRWQEADDLINRMFRLDPPQNFRVCLQRLQIRSVLWRGDPDAAWDLRETWWATMSAQEEIDIETRASNGLDLTHVALARDDLDTAWAYSRTVIDRPVDSSGLALPLLGAFAAVIARRRTSGSAPDQLDRAEQELRLELARHSDWPTHAIWAAYVDASLSSGDQASWQRALTSAGAAEAPVTLRIMVLRETARAQLRSGDRVGAASTLDGLRELGARIGSGLAVSWADADARSAGLVEAPTASESPLTAREEQVLELIADGLSNGQIAEHLFISPKTVSVHVSAILRKLGATTRTQAALLIRA